METLDTTKSQSKKSGCFAWGLAGVIAVAFVWRVVSVTRSSIPPFADKDRVLDAIAWRVPIYKHGEMDEDVYTWQDNETIVYTRLDPQQKYPLMRQRVRGGNVSEVQPILNSPLMVHPYEVAASPDGKWLFVANYGQRERNEYTIIDVKSGAVKQKYLTPNSFVSWMQDSRSFFCQEIFSGSIVQYGVSSSKEERHLLNQINRGLSVVSPQGAFFIGNYYGGNPSPPRLERGSIFTGKSQINSIPRYGSVLDSSLYSVSPQGERLLWYQTWSDRSWFSELWGKVTRHGATPNTHEAWYITDADGSNPRTWAIVHTQDYHYAYSSRRVVFPKWLPDGKHLSVVYKGALYVVEVP